MARALLFLAAFVAIFSPPIASAQSPEKPTELILDADGIIDVTIQGTPLRFKVDPGLQTHRIEHQNEVFGDEIAACSGREGAAAKSA